MSTLNPNSLLQGGRYKIIKTLGQGGFGITYLAVQSGLERKVAIKEFFMKELCERDESTSHVTLGTTGGIRETVARFREKFLKEARNIARLNHPNIVRIIDVFEENGTAYYVMEYAGNGSLADKVKRYGHLSETTATRYILQVASALDYVHQQKMNHLDVKPANIMVNEKNECVLIDFGLSKQYDLITGGQTSTTPVGISEGYAPIEQYMQGGVGVFSPETDIYALGATFYTLLTGTIPPNASYIICNHLPVNELKSIGVSKKAIDVICKAMAGRKTDRTKTVQTFIDRLKGNDDDEVTVLIADKAKAEDLHQNEEEKQQRHEEAIPQHAKIARQEVAMHNAYEREKQKRLEGESIKLYRDLLPSTDWTLTYLKLCGGFAFGLFVFLYILYSTGIVRIELAAVIFVFAFIFCIICSAFLTGKVIRSKETSAIKNYINSHSTDEHVPYLLQIIHKLENENNPYSGGAMFN